MVSQNLRSTKSTRETIVHVTVSIHGNLRIPPPMPPQGNNDFHDPSQKSSNGSKTPSLSWFPSNFLIRWLESIPFSSVLGAVCGGILVNVARLTCVNLRGNSPWIPYTLNTPWNILHGTPKKNSPLEFRKNIYNYNPSILGVPCIFFSGVYTLQHVFLHPSIFFIEKTQVNIWAIFRGWMVSDSHKATPILRSFGLFLGDKKTI